MDGRAPREAHGRRRKKSGCHLGPRRFCQEDQSSAPTVNPATGPKSTEWVREAVCPDPSRSACRPLGLSHPGRRLGRLTARRRPTSAAGGHRTGPWRGPCRRTYPRRGQPRSCSGRRRPCRLRRCLALALAAFSGGGRHPCHRPCLPPSRGVRSPPSPLPPPPRPPPPRPRRRRGPCPCQRHHSPCRRRRPCRRPCRRRDCRGHGRRAGPLDELLAKCLGVHLLHLLEELPSLRLSPWISSLSVSKQMCSCRRPCWS